MKINSLSIKTSPISSIKKASKATVLLATSLLSASSLAKMSDDFIPVYKNKVEVVSNISDKLVNKALKTDKLKHDIPIPQEEITHRFAITLTLLGFFTPILLNLFPNKSK